MSNYTLIVSYDGARSRGESFTSLDDALTEAARIFWYTDSAVTRIEDENGNEVAGRAEIDKAIDELKAQLAAI